MRHRSLAPKRRTETLPTQGRSIHIMPPWAAPSSPPLAPPPSSPPLAPPPPPPPAGPTGQDLIFPEVFVVALLVFCTLLFLIAECCKNYVHGQRDNLANRNRGYITRDVEQPRWLRQCVAVATPQFVVAEYRGDERKFDTDECVICLEDFEEGDECGMLEKCSHAYHESCIRVWLSKQRNCPLCRCEVRVEWEVRVAPDSPASSPTSSSSNSW